MARSNANSRSVSSVICFNSRPPKPLAPQDLIRRVFGVVLSTSMRVVGKSTAEFGGIERRLGRRVALIVDPRPALHTITHGPAVEDWLDPPYGCYWDVAGKIRHRYADKQLTGLKFW